MLTVVIIVRNFDFFNVIEQCPLLGLVSTPSELYTASQPYDVFSGNSACCIARIKN
jgi:hypothetical protein